MRFDEINEAGGINGRKLRVIVEDQGYQVPKAVQACNKLINRDKVFAFVGPLGTPMNNACFKEQFAAGVRAFFSGHRQGRAKGAKRFLGEVRGILQHYRLENQLEKAGRKLGKAGRNWGKLGRTGENERNGAARVG
jgi:branched-chain amino acid transport system substrate-binding protein